jgi:mannan endo-1,4-beta-mannosidase
VLPDWTYLADDLRPPITLEERMKAKIAVAGCALALLTACGGQPVVASAASNAPARTGGSASSSPAPQITPQATSRLKYLGVSENGAADYAPEAAFGQMAGRMPNLVMYYSNWNEPFPTSYAQTAAAHGASLLISLLPYSTSMTAIGNGSYNAYLRSYARQVRSLGHQVVLSFAPEMNGSWYTWGYKNTSAKVYIKAFRKVVTVFRKAGATNVTWLWVANQMNSNLGLLASYWPGSAYVSWMAVDGYYYTKGATFNGIFAKTIAEERSLSSKPIIVGETAIGQVAGQARRIPQLFAGLRQYGLIGLVWFDIAQSGSEYKQNWRLETDPSGAKAFRKAVKKYF